MIITKKTRGMLDYQGDYCVSINSNTEDHIKQAWKNTSCSSSHFSLNKMRIITEI